MEIVFSEQKNIFNKTQCCVSARYDHDQSNIATLILGKTWSEVKAQFPTIDTLFSRINTQKEMKKEGVSISFDNLNTIRNIDLYSC